MYLQRGKNGEQRHNRINVYGEMMLQVAMTYRSAPDVRTMTLDEIEFFYNGIRDVLIQSTKPSENA